MFAAEANTRIAVAGCSLKGMRHRGVTATSLRRYLGDVVEIGGSRRYFGIRLRTAWVLLEAGRHVPNAGVAGPMWSKQYGGR